MDCLSLILKIKCSEGCQPSRPIPDWWGRAVQKAFLTVIADRDSALAESLHSTNSSRRNPYTVSSMIGHKPRSYLTQCTYGLRFTTVQPQVVTLLLEEVQGGVLRPGKTIELDRICFEIIETEWRGGEWAAVYSWEKLADMIESLDLEGCDTLTLEFVSPTYFKTQERFEPLPLPELVFDSLVSMAEKWAGYRPPLDMKEYAYESIRIEGSAGLRTNYLELRRSHDGKAVRRIGSTGRLLYRFVDPDPEIIRAYYHLAYIAFFVGVGKGTTIGCGQVRPVF